VTLDANARLRPPSALTQPVIIEVAINGATKKNQNPHVPITPAEIAADALACLNAGAAIIHNHIDILFCPDQIAAERYLEGWRPVLDTRPAALLYPTINIVPGGEISYDHQQTLAETGLLRIAAVDPGSLNLGSSGADGVPIGDFVYQNNHSKIAHVFDLCRNYSLGPSLAIYEPGWLRTVLAWWHAGRLPQGSMLKFYLSTDRGLAGAPFGLPPTPTALNAYLEILGDCPLPWAVSVVGGDVALTEVARLALEHGGHLHIGLEFYGGNRQPTNVELVTEAVGLCESVGRKIATSSDAAELLDLPRR